MIIIATAVLFHVMASHDVIWEGVTSAWILAAMIDAALLALFIHEMFADKRANGEWFELDETDVEHTRGLADE